MKNELLSELPGKEHYTVCCKRKKEIDRISKLIFVYTIISGAFMLLFTFLAFPVRALSWIPSIFGDSTSAGFIIIQCAEILIMAVLGFMNCLKFKISGIILFFIYSIMMIACFVGGIKAVNSFSFIFAAAGVFVTFRSFTCYSDYKQLEQTEGFPYFNDLLDSDNSAIIYNPNAVPRTSDVMSSVNISEITASSVYGNNAESSNASMPEI